MANYIFNSDYSAFKHDDTDEISITIPAGTTWGARTRESAILGRVDKAIGSHNSGFRAIGKTSKSARWGVGTTVFFELMTTFIPQGATFSAYYHGTLYRSSPNNVRLIVAPSGIGTSPTSGTADYRIEEPVTVTFKVATFLSPFQ